MARKKMRWWKFWGDYFSSLEFGDSINALELGCGRTPTRGCVTIDRDAALGADVCHDLNVVPWPFASESFDVIVAFSVIEHVHDPIKVLVECHRILRPGGKVVLLTPHFSAAGSYVDPTHLWHLSAQSFDYLIQGTDLEHRYGSFATARYVMTTRLISLAGAWEWVPGLQYFVNRFPGFWEKYLCFIIRGEGLYFELGRA